MFSFFKRRTVLFSKWGANQLSSVRLQHTKIDIERKYMNIQKAPHIPGHQPEMPDSVKLLLRDVTYLGFHTDCLLKSIDWRFLYQNFIKIGQVVKILQDFEVKTNFLLMAEFSIKTVKESISKFLSFLIRLSWELVNGLVWKKIWCSFINLSNNLLSRTNLVSLAQNIAKWENGEKHCCSIFPSKKRSGRKEVFYLNTCKI